MKRPSSLPDTKMPPTSNTLLHVVYAGRGDAFILEYTTAADNKRYFVLVDSGPLGTGKTH
jgi:hypothetical protein